MPRRPRDQELLRRFGARVASLRSVGSLTQQMLADRAGVRPEAISQIESGKLSPTLTTLVVLARGLGVRPSALLDFEEVVSPNPLGPEEAELLEGYRALGEEGRRLVRGVTRGLAR